jgi:hypothetical protein
MLNSYRKLYIDLVKQKFPASMPAVGRKRKVGFAESPNV